MNQSRRLTGKDICTYYTNKWQSLKGYVPGDVQRGLRTFMSKAKLHGVRKLGRNEYVYTPLVRTSTPDACTNDTARTFTGRLKTKITNRFRRRCALCNNDTRSLRGVIDHWIPHSRGGKTLEKNGVLLCEQCNVTKGDKNHFHVALNVIKRTIDIDRQVDKSEQYKIETIREVDMLIEELNEYACELLINK